MRPRQNLASSCCPKQLHRRGFLAVAGASALVSKFGIMGLPAFGEERRSSRKPHVRAFFLGPSTDRYWMSWPGASFDPETCRDEYTRALARAAKDLDVQLDVSPVFVDDPDSVADVLAQLAEHRPDGLIINLMHLKSWPQAEYFAKHRGAVPMIVFSPLGTTFADRQRATRGTPQTFVATTQDYTWLATGLRMLRTIWDLKTSRICMVTESARGDHQVGSVGTTLHYVPLSRWINELREAETTDQMREFAKFYGIEARDVVEPATADLLNAAKNYVVARRIMADENCQGISVDCSPLICDRQAACGPCMAWSRLLDEGVVAACEADADAAITLLLTSRLLDRPGFMQDPAPNSVNNTVIASHCTCATRLNGYDQPRRPFVLRSHAESDTGAAMQVLWPQGQEVSIMKFQRPASLLVGTGRVVGNVEAPHVGGCRTAVELAVDGMEDSRNIKGFHQVLVCGKSDQLLRAYGELSGLELMRL